MSSSSRNRGLAVAFLATVLVITWVLASSIAPLTVSPGGSAGVSGGIRAVGTGGAGTGIGSGTGSGAGVSPPGIPLPSVKGLQGVLNYSSLPYLPFRINISSFTPYFNLTPMPFNLSVPYSSFRIYLPSIRLPSLLPGGSGPGRSSGPSTGVAIVEPFSMQWLLYVILAAVAVLLVVAILGGIGPLSSIMVHTWKGRMLRPGSGSSRPGGGRGGEGPGAGSQSGLSALPLRGWGGSEYIELAVGEDLPLIWRAGDPLGYSLKQAGTSVEIFPEGEAGQGSILFRSPGCHEIRVVKGGASVEGHTVLVVEDYSRSVLDSFRANMVAGGAQGIEEKTPREVCAELSARGLLDGQACGSWRSLRVFEEARYGRYPVERMGYEEFLRGLKGLRGAVIVGCGQRE